MSRRRWVVGGPNHGPRVDVVKQAARSWPPLTVATAPWKAGVFLTGLAVEDGAEISPWEQGQPAKDV